MQARRLFLDTQTRQFVGGLNSFLAATPLTFFDEDVETIELYFLGATGAGQQYRPLDYSANSVKFAIGQVAPAVLQTTWTPLSIAVSASVSALTEGGPGASEVQRLSFSGRSAVSGAFVLKMPDRNLYAATFASNIATLADHGLLNGQAINISSIEIAGTTYDDFTFYVTERNRSTFRIAFTRGGAPIGSITNETVDILVPAITTEPIPATATAFDVQNALAIAGFADNGSSQIFVTGSYSDGFVLSFYGAMANVAFPLFLVSHDLTAAPALSSTVNFATEEMQQLILGGVTEAVLEIEVSGGGMRHTYQTTAQLGFDILNDTTGNEAIPVVETQPTSFNLMAPNGSVYTVSVTNQGAVQTIIDSVATSAPTGLTLVAPSLTKYQITVSNNGIVQTTAI